MHLTFGVCVIVCGCEWVHEWSGYKHTYCPHLTLGVYQERLHHARVSASPLDGECLVYVFPESSEASVMLQSRPYVRAETMLDEGVCVCVDTDLFEHYF